ncbi:sensor histidine kinase [Meiothermus ruber]|jgi:two-component system sensor histidine kinase DesK|uniref:Histidine kinase n=1 Tax=Meiothermus ruber (strain ATCC 35948 / DSM 1279 / VKM B-1258 / 21) TaxID=504728 RepID=D3PRE4_MEIRD|nr:sensor histidine kinase [Meiothermus ruber]ADD28027.1 histidine kinase [Meiothermus ruber DSM 1279]AGK04497.1 histidine kinase [Meiothermus ruber DSM 1279]GAO74973.1 histidine kinase [Meiothermus ruber H328]
MPTPQPNRSPARRPRWYDYAYLVYLANLLWQPALDPGFSRVDAAVTLLSVAICLLFFLRRPHHNRARLVATAALAALGLTVAPFNYGANVYLIYAAAFAGGLWPSRLALRVVWGLVGLTAFYFLILMGVGTPAQISMVSSVLTAVFVLGVGLSNLSETKREQHRRELEAALEENQRLAAIAERERIARDLHDLLGHTLSVITLKAELAARLAGRDPARAAQEMREVERISREATAQVREAVQGYRSRGLQGELAGARLALQTAGIRFDCYIQPLTLSPTQESVLGLALREAVTNVIRHSGATCCAVRLLKAGGGVLLEVEDDGKGGVLEEGSGLQGMRQRAEALGGRLERSSNGGTKLRLWLPTADPERTSSQALPKTLHPSPDTL